MHLTPYHKVREAKLPPRARLKSQRLTKRYLAELDLTGLRESQKVTQVELARRLSVAQVTVSRLEKRRDFKFSTLRNVARALGGQLEVRFVFPKGSVVLAQRRARRKRG